MSSSSSADSSSGTQSTSSTGKSATKSSATTSAAAKSSGPEGHHGRRKPTMKVKSAARTVSNEEGDGRESDDTKSVGKSIICRRPTVIYNKTELRLNALAGVVQGDQAADYEIGELVFVNHNGVPWPARIEDPSNVTEPVTRFEYAVFLYGLHQRKRVRLKDVFLYEQNLEAFEGKNDNVLLNVGMTEIRTDPDCNLKKVPSHKKKPIRYLMKSRSHTFLERYLDGPAIHLVSEESESETPATDDISYNPFQSEGYITYDSALGYFTITSSFLFMLYMTWWMLVMPFLEPKYFSLIEGHFPNPSESLVYPITGGAILSCSIIAFFGAVMYGPRVHDQQQLVVLPQRDEDAPLRHTRMEEFLQLIQKGQPAIFILLLSALFTLTPFKFFALSIIAFSGFYLLYDFILYL